MSISQDHRHRGNESGTRPKQEEKRVSGKPSSALLHVWAFFRDRPLGAWTWTVLGVLITSYIGATMPHPKYLYLVGLCATVLFWIYLHKFVLWVETPTLPQADSQIAGVVPLKADPIPAPPQVPPGPPARPANLLIPANEPDPPLVAELLKKASEQTRASMSDPSRPGLKILFGSNLGGTTKDSQLVVRMEGEDMLTIHRSAGGIAIDARFFDAERSILAKLEKNVFHVSTNPAKVFHSDTPDPSTLVVYDAKDEVVLNVHFANPHCVRLLGTFRQVGMPPVVVRENGVFIRDQRVLNGVVSIDNRAALFNFVK